MECYASIPVFITIEDQKPNFRNNTKCRLINPAKKELGLVSKKHIWENLSQILQRPSKSTNDETLPLPHFIKLDIVRFYP